MFQDSYDVEVISEVSSDFYCVICLKLMQKAIHMHCGHGMCNACFQKLVKSSNERNVPVCCPTCRKHIDEEKVFPVPMIDRIILATNVKCSNGCEWIGDLGDMRNHQEQKCDYERIPCVFAGCDKKISRNETQEHEGICHYRLVVCEYCQEQCHYRDIPIHMRSCPFYMIICINPCCDQMIPRCKMEDHLLECPYAKVECTYQSIGCSVKLVRQDFHQHLLDSTQQHLLLLMTDSVEKKTTIKELLQDSVGKNKTIDDLVTDSVEKKNTIADLLTDSVEKKKTIDDLVTDSVVKKKTIEDLLTDSVEMKKTIDKLSAANQILNHDLNKLKADFDILKETVAGTSKDQIFSNAKLGGIFKDMCQEDEFQKILLKEFDDCLNKTKEIKQKYQLNIFMSSMLVEDKERQLIDAMSQEMQVEKNNFIKNEMIVKYTQKVIDGIDDFVKMKVDSPPLCCKQITEQLKSHIKTFHYFEHMNQVRKFYGNIEDMLNLNEIESSFNEGHDYFRIKSTSLSDKVIYLQRGIGVNVVLNPLIVSSLIKLKDVCLVNAAGISSYAEHSYGPRGLRHVYKYKWVQSYSRLKELGFIVKDIFILKINFDDTDW